MKFKCRKTDTEITQEREERISFLKEYYKNLWENGETVFAFLPKHFPDGTCAWLEKVQRRPIGYHYGMGWSARYDRGSEMFAWAMSSNGGKAIWRYYSL